LTTFFKFPLPEIKSRLKSLIDRFFVILADYAGLGAAGNKATILELNQLLFKVFANNCSSINLGLFKSGGDVEKI
jgi:hypothetical protein